MSGAGDVERGPAGAAPPGGALRPPPGRQGPPQGTFYYDPSAAYNEKTYKPWLVPIIVLVNIALFILVMYYNNCPANLTTGECFAKFLGRFSFQPLRENPLFGPSSTTLQNFGALSYEMIVKGKQAWRLESSAWLHAGLIHLLANMISLLFIGIRLEQQFGFWRVGLIYFFSGLGAATLSTIFLGRQISVGASGCLFGLLGAMVAEIITNWTIYENRCAALANMLLIALINLTLGILPHVDNFSHIGGFVSGFLLGFVLLMQPSFDYMQQRAQPLGVKPQPRFSAFQIILLVLGLLLFLGGFAAALAVLFTGVNGNEVCGWCHYVTCVPTPSWTCDV